MQADSVVQDCSRPGLTARPQSGPACPLRDREHKATRAPAVPLPAGPVPQDLSVADRAGCWQQGLSTVPGMTSDELGPRAIGEPSQEEQEMGPET